MQVWLIDDDPEIGADLRLLLPAGIELIQFLDSATAIDRLQTLSLPDAILLDLCLPPHLAAAEQGEGLALLKQLTTSLVPGVPVIVLTNLPRDQYAAECLERGAAAYHQKPCAIAALTRDLETVTA